MVAATEESKPMRQPGWGITFVVLALTIVLVASLKDGINPAAAAATAPDRSNVLNNAEFVAKNHRYIAAIADLIRARGYDCPALSQLWARGETPYGLKFEALCGPNTGKRDSYPALHYAIYPDRLMVNVCQPFQLFGPPCT